MQNKQTNKRKQIRTVFYHLKFINCHFSCFDCYLDNIISGHRCHPSVSKCIDTGALRPLLGVDFHIKISRDDWIHNSNVLKEKKKVKGKTDHIKRSEN